MKTIVETFPINTYECDICGLRHPNKNAVKVCEDRHKNCLCTKGSDYNLVDLHFSINCKGFTVICKSCGRFIVEGYEITNQELLKYLWENRNKWK